MTNEQKNQVAAMNASGMGVDEIVIDTGLNKVEVEAFVAERNEKKGKRATITPELRKAVIEWHMSGHTERQSAIKFGVSQSTVHRIVTEAKEKEPAAVAPATDSKKEKPIMIFDTNDTTSSAENQALEAAKKKLLAIYETLTPEETRAWELGEVYAEITRGLKED